jgi:succinate dehydrogenase hydrophobic anchor subunit
VSFSPDGTRILSGSSDNTIKLWKTKKSKEIMTIHLLPGNEWLTYQPGCLFYTASHQGDEWAAIRFNNSNDKIFPLTYYKDQLKKTDWHLANRLLTPDIKPKYLRRFWDRTSTQTLAIFSCIFIAFAGTLIIVLRKKHSNPMTIAAAFFEKAGYSKIEKLDYPIENTDEKITCLRLFPDRGVIHAIAGLWQKIDDTVLQNETSQFAEKTANKVKLYVLYTDKMPSVKDLQIFRNKCCEVVPIALKRLEKSALDDQPANILKAFEDPYITRTDPYTESKPVNDPMLFFGRQSFMDSLPGLIGHGQHVGLFGLRKVGKTSLINHLCHHFSHIPTVFISCQGMLPEAVLYFEAIYQKLHKELRLLKIKKIPSVKPVKDADQFRKNVLALSDCWQNDGNSEPFIIIFDEIDQLFSDRQLTGSEKNLSQYLLIFRTLRGMAETDQNLVLSVAGYRPHVNRYNVLTQSIGENPMFQSFKEEYIGFFNPADSRIMIEEIGGLQDINWDPDAADQVYDYCGGHPLVTRMFASMACDNGMRKHVDLKQCKATAQKIVKTFRINPIGNYFQESIFNLMTSEESQCLCLICQAENHRLSENNIPQELENAMTNLEHFGIIKNDNGMIVLTSKLFTRWLKRRC